MGEKIDILSSKNLPPHLLGKRFLEKEGDASDKVWDEMLLTRWERECNDGRPWSGRPGLGTSG